MALADSLLIRGMAVDPQFRGQKIGRALLEVAEDSARALGLHRMSLYTTAFLGNAIALYRSSGFEFTGENISPQGTELLHMVKVLAGTIERASTKQRKAR